MKKKKTFELAVDFLAGTALLVLLCSCISFDIADWPSRFVYPHNSDTSNFCGPMGAFFAYYLLYYIGPGVFVLLGAAISLVCTRIFKGKVSQAYLRLTGMALVAAGISSTFYFFWPNSFFGFPMGSGGLVGIGAVEFLHGQFGLLGTFILITATWVVGMVLLADDAVVTFLRIFGMGLKKTAGGVLPAWSVAKEHSEVLGEIWRKLSAAQKTPPTLPEPSFSINKDRELETRVTAQAKNPENAVAVTPLQAGVNAAPKIPASTGAAKTAAKKEPVPQGYIPKSYDDYALPPLELLDEPEYGYSAVQETVVKAKAAALERLLSEFDVNARVAAADTGPVVTMFELELGAGVKVSQISSLSNDIARALEAGAVRVVAPLPGKHTIGIEVPNNEKEKVRMKDMLMLAGEKPEKMAIPLFLGKDSSGDALVSDLTEMPHLLIAGTTGSGKSVCINTIIGSILMTKRPDEVKMILVDPKMVEMTAFNTVPHLMSPIVTETKRAVQVLEWATVKMDERYALLAEARVKNIADYNKLTTEEIVERFKPTSPDEEAKIPKKLPYIVIIIDELADLMMTAPKEIEAYIVRLAQKSRAVGIHIVLATQRPQATVVTGLIKSNMPTRIGFRVAARMDSRIILDQNGAETLLGQGDMLFLKPGTSDLIRAQGAFVSDMEVKRIVKHLKEVAEPQYHPELTQLGRVSIEDMEKDEVFDEAVRVVLESGRGSVSLLQRRLSIGYARASRIIELMAASGILGEYKGSQAREVMMTLEEYEQMCSSNQAQPPVDETAETVEKNSLPEPAYISEGQRGYVSVDEAED